MSEVDIQRAEQLAKVFLPEYNRIHGSNYKWTEDSFKADAENERGVDICFYDQDGNSLEVQHTRAVGNEELDFKRPAIANKILSELTKLRSRYSYRQAFVYFRLAQLPSTNEEVVKLAHDIWMLIAYKLPGSEAKYYFTYDFLEDDPLLERIRKYISHIEIIALPEKQGVVFGVSSTPRGAAWIDDRGSVVNAVNNKQHLSPDLVLLVEATTFPIDDFYIESIVDDIKDRNFEIWLVETFFGRERAIQLKHAGSDGKND